MKNISQLLDLLGSDKDLLLNHICKTIPKETRHLPSSNHLDDCFLPSNRNNQTIRSLNQLYQNGRLSNTGYLSILPVDQGIEHTAGSAFAPNPIYFDPENIIKLAIESGCKVDSSF
jgi:fructose-bisphosphate aldolase, class I